MITLDDLTKAYARVQIDIREGQGAGLPLEVGKNTSEALIDG
jgi:hypothetical protein